MTHLRNKVAHGFKEISSKELNIYTAKKNAEKMLKQVIDPDKRWFNYFERLNQTLLTEVSSIQPDR